MRAFGSEPEPTRQGSQGGRGATWNRLEPVLAVGGPGGTRASAEGQGALRRRGALLPQRSPSMRRRSQRRSAPIARRRRGRAPAHRFGGVGDRANALSHAGRGRQAPPFDQGGGVLTLVTALHCRDRRRGSAGAGARRCPRSLMPAVRDAHPVIERAQVGHAHEHLAPAARRQRQHPTGPRPSAASCAASCGGSVVT